ncbi:hypothetical protein BDZ91DRAFT_734638, partial [Kalaharituber pfeilii]
WDLYFVFFFFFYSILILFPYLILCPFYHCELADGLYFCSYCRGNVMITFRESCYDGIKFIGVNKITHK